MPDDTTPASTTPSPADGAAPQPSAAELQKRAEAAEAQADSARRDADQAKRYLVDLVARMGQGQAGQQAAQQQAAPEATAEDLIQEFKENPVGLLDRHFAARMGPVLQEHLEDRGKLNRQYFIDQNKDDWEEYGNEVDAFMAPMSLSTKAKMGSWQEGLNYIKAKHIDKIVEKKMAAQKEAEKRGLLEGRGASPGAGNGKRPYRLSDLEKNVAKGFGMTEEEWISNKTPSEKGEFEEEPF